MRDRHCEAAKPPKPSRLTGPRVMSGRRILWPRPILDCFVLAFARARNDGGGGSRAGGEGTAMPAVIAAPRPTVHDAAGSCRGRADRTLRPVAPTAEGSRGVRSWRAIQPRLRKAHPLRPVSAPTA